MFQALAINLDPKWSERLEKALHSMNMSCIFCSNYHNALAKISANGAGIVIVFVDHHQEVENHEFLSRIKVAPPHSRPIIGLSHDKVSIKADSFVDTFLDINMDEMLLRSIIDHALYPPEKPEVHKQAAKAKILVVEDNPVEAEFLIKRLSKEGYVPYLASNGAIGLEELEKFRPDLIILDINMPVLDGLALCSHLKSHEATEAIPIITVSSDDRKQDSLNASANLFLQKPIKHSQLIAEITRLLS